MGSEEMSLKETLKTSRNVMRIFFLFHQKSCSLSKMPQTRTAINENFLLPLSLILQKIITRRSTITTTTTPHHWSMNRLRRVGQRIEEIKCEMARKIAFAAIKSAGMTNTRQIVRVQSDHEVAIWSVRRIGIILRG